MKMIEPINELQQRQVVSATYALIEHAGQLFGRKFEKVPLLFDLKGRAAGQYRVSSGKRVIRYNPYIFARCFEENLHNTVAHEVAHYITDELYGNSGHGRSGARAPRPHGREWQAVMQSFGVKASRTCSIDLSGVPVRRYSYYTYTCACRSHQLGSRRHYRVKRGQANYYCRHCRGRLYLRGDGETS